MSLQHHRRKDIFVLCISVFLQIARKLLFAGMPLKTYTPRHEAECSVEWHAVRPGANQFGNLMTGLHTQRKAMIIPLYSESASLVHPVRLPSRLRKG